MSGSILAFLSGCAIGLLEVGICVGIAERIVTGSWPTIETTVESVLEMIFGEFR